MRHKTWIGKCHTTKIMEKIMKAVKIIVTGTENAKKAVTDAVEKSIYFEFTPLPDDTYEIKVKPEAEKLLSVSN